MLMESMVILLQLKEEHGYIFPSIHLGTIIDPAIVNVARIDGARGLAETGPASDYTFFGWLSSISLGMYSVK